MNTSFVDLFERQVRALAQRAAHGRSVEAAPHQEGTEAGDRLWVVGHRATSQVPIDCLAGSFGLSPREHLLGRRAFVPGIPFAESLERLALHAVLAQLRLQHPLSARCMPIPLLGPPASECVVVQITERAQPIRRLRNHIVLGPRPPEPLLQLPAAPRASGEEARGDFEGGGGVRALSRPGRPAGAGPRRVLRA